MRIVVYPGTFDPVHNGHIDIANRASLLFDKLIFAIAVNPEKNSLFNAEERIELMVESTKHLKNVETYSTAGLIVEFADEHGACALIRGLRHVSDFEFEFQMAMMNYHLNPKISTILMMPDEKYIHLNSTVVKDVAKLQGNIIDYVPDIVLKRMKEKFGLI